MTKWKECTNTCQSCAYCSINIIDNLAGVPKELGGLCTLNQDTISYRVDAKQLTADELSTHSCPHYLWHRPGDILRGKDGDWRKAE